MSSVDAPSGGHTKVSQHDVNITHTRTGIDLHRLIRVHVPYQSTESLLTETKTSDGERERDRDRDRDRDRERQRDNSINVRDRAKERASVNANVGGRGSALCCRPLRSVASCLRRTETTRASERRVP